VAGIFTLAGSKAVVPCQNKIIFKEL